MEILGDLERAAATLLYPNRVPIAIVTLVVLAAIVVLAARRRWDLAARRHPRTTMGVGLLALAIGGPTGWYLGSPLVLSTTIDEPAPVVAATTRPEPAASVAPASVRPGASSSAAPVATPKPTPSPAPTPAPIALTGEFHGADDFHFGRGTARLIETAPGTFVVRLEDLAVRNGPDLFVYLSPAPAGYADGAIELGRLKADRGNQNYEVPADTDVSGARSVVIWCRQFAVLFATAPLG